MKYSVVLSAIGSATVALGHGLVSQIEIAGTTYDNYSPYVDPYLNPKVERIGWTTESNGPVEDVSTAAIACNTGSTAGAISATAAAGSAVKFFWTVWPESHRGPTMTYLARCPGTDCTTADPTTLDWFKIDEAGLNSDGTWASDTLIANNNTWSLTLPSDIAAGPYLMRHELLALHGAGSVNGAQFYPMCANLQITGSGSAVPSDTVKFPGGYTSSDPGILINIYYPVPTTYTIPGPAVYVPGGASASSSSAVVATSATSVAAITEVAATTDAAATTDIVEASTTIDAVPTTFIGTGPATFPTLAPSAQPPYGNNTRVATRTRTRGHGASSQVTPIVDATQSFSVAPAEQTDIAEVTTEIVYVTAPAAAPTTASPVTTIKVTETSTVEKTVILTFTASAVETVTVTEQGSAECTPVGRHRRGTYLM